MTLSTVYAELLSDLGLELPAAVRQQRLAKLLRTHFRCGAVALLALDASGDSLRPEAVDGLTPDALGRRFALMEHPRLAAILRRAGVTRFHHDSGLPDPYDGLVIERPGEPLHVHDCMGIALAVEGRPWGVLTLDALDVGTFDEPAQRQLAQLLPLIEAVVRVGRLEGALRVASQSAGVPVTGAPPVDEDRGLLGDSPPMQQLLHELGIVADTELPVLLLGETGVGKELFARRLHALSRRRAQPLVHINCAALPEALAESELFGHVRGAFAGAVEDRAGRFEAADGGTLLLEEVGALPLAVQAQLLRTLQGGTVRRQGAAKARAVDVRVIATTNRSLREQVQGGAFRADLYHRLSVYPITIPPLRERGRDVLLLAGRLLEVNRARLGLRSLRLSPEAKQALRRYAWPGNVRELEQVIGRAALKAVSRGATRTEIVTLGAELLDLDAAPAAAPAPSAGHLAADAAAEGAGTLRERVEACQRAAIEQALAAHRGRWAGAARELGLDPSNLHKLAQRLGCAPARQR